MTSYNPKEWIGFIFSFSKADTFQKLIPMMLIIGTYSGIIGYLEIEYWDLPEDSHVKNISVMHSLLGFVISLLLAYRTNTAYDRWWEGRRMWGGLVNSSRNLAIKLSVILKEESDRAYFRKMIPGYASILQKHLNDSDSLLLQCFYQEIHLHLCTHFTFCLCVHFGLLCDSGSGFYLLCIGQFRINC